MQRREAAAVGQEVTGCFFNHLPEALEVGPVLGSTFTDKTWSSSASSGWRTSAVRAAVDATQVEDEAVVLFGALAQAELGRVFVELEPRKDEVVELHDVALHVLVEPTALGPDEELKVRREVAGAARVTPLGDGAGIKLERGDDAQRVRFDDLDLVKRVL